MRNVVSNLSIGLVTSPSEESNQLISLLETLGVEVTYNISPEEITSSHIENQMLNVWLLNIDDDHWHDNIDQLLDESDASIYFNEPGTLIKQSHPDFWCEKLVNRLYELTGLSKDTKPQQKIAKQPAHTEVKASSEELQVSTTALESVEDLSLALDELETSSIGLPKDIAADLVLELESISPDLGSDIDDLDPDINDLDTTAVEPFSLDDEFSFDEDFSLEDDESLEEEEEVEEELVLEIEAPLHQNDTLLTSELSIEQEFFEAQGEVENPQTASEIMELTEDTESQDLDLNELDFDNLSLDSIGAIDDIVINDIVIEPTPEINSHETSVTEKPLETGDLSLEPVGDINESVKVSGRAQYVIDDQPKDSEIDAQQTEQNSPIDAFAVEEHNDDNLGLHLEPIETVAAEEPDWFKDEAEEIEPNADDEAIILNEEMVLDESTVLDEITVLDPDSPSVQELNPEEGISLELEQSEMRIETTQEQPIEFEEQVFEIPMLEEAATGLDFEQVTKQTGDELTPCWVIGASLGGPAAVKRFLQSLPADINVSFIVVQHIDENFLPVLADILTSNSHFEVSVATGSNSIDPGKVYLAPLKGKLVFLKDGSMLVDHSQKWSAPYMPCIDDVIESLAGIYGDKSGAIIFSGMGHDGLEGVKKMKLLDGQVWAQSVETCANSSMPEAVINAGLASVVASPEMLADRLVNYISRQMVY